MWDIKLKAVSEQTSKTNKTHRCRQQYSGYQREVGGRQIHNVCPKGIQPCTEEDTRYKKRCTQGKDALAPFKVGTLGPHTVLSIAIRCPIVFS